MERLQGSFLSIDQMADTYLQGQRSPKGVNTDSQGLTFEQILAQKANAQEVTFSKHANQRLLSRNINLDESQLMRLNRGIMQAKEKSINESLVMMDNIAFIVNIRNNTVVTAMDQDYNDSNVFTNIDGAVIV